MLNGNNRGFQHGSWNAEPEHMEQQDRPAPGRRRDPVADLFSFRSRQKERAFPPLDGLDAFRLATLV